MDCVLVKGFSTLGNSYFYNRVSLLSTDLLLSLELRVEPFTRKLITVPRSEAHFHTNIPNLIFD